MKIDLSCPAEILLTELPGTEQPFGVLTLFNLADRSIVSCEATLRLIDREGREISRAVHRARALTGRPHTAFTMTVPADANPAAVRAEAVLDKIWFEDNDVWRRNSEQEIEYESNVLPPSPALNALKFTAGENAVGFPSQQPKLWVCVCGRPNRNDSAFCVRCLRQKDLIFSRYNRDEVEKALARRERQLDLKSRSAREEDIRLQRIREAEYNQQKQRSLRRKRLLVAFLCVLALVAAVHFAGVPALRLVSAKSQTENGRYEQARQILTELGSFPGAEKALADCENRIARRDAAASDDAAVLLAAAERLRASGDEETDAALADSADFRRAGLLLEAGQIAEAEALLRALPADYPGRADQLNACLYEKAAAAMKNREYDAARELFLSLGSFRDAETQAKACLYEPALILLESGKYDDAIALLEQIPDYEDSAEQIRKSHYLKGFVLESAGDTDAARESYLAAGNYEDAKDRADAILMAKADALMEQKDYESALPLYQSLDGTADAREKWTACAVSLATRQYKRKAYLEAIAVLDALPEQTRESSALLDKAINQAARAAAKNEEYADAIALMERLQDDKDAQTLLRTWKYTLARQWMEAEKWEEVIPLLEDLGNYRNAPRWLRQARAALESPEPDMEEGASNAEASAEQPQDGNAQPQADNPPTDEVH